MSEHGFWNFRFLFSIELITILQWFNQCRIRMVVPPGFVHDASLPLAVGVCNHPYQIDTFFFLALSDHVVGLGACKAFLKAELAYLPLAGWLFTFGEYIFLQRNWAEDKQVLGPCLDKFMDFPFAVHLVIFPEGTRFTREKHRASLEYCREKGLACTLRHHLRPRAKGLAMTLKYLQEKREYFPSIVSDDNLNLEHAPTPFSW